MSSPGNFNVDAFAIRDRCTAFVANLLGDEKDSIDVGAEFDQLGLDSAMAVSMIFDLEEWLCIELSPSLLFDHTTIASLAAHLAGETSRSPSVIERAATAA